MIIFDTARIIRSLHVNSALHPFGVAKSSTSFGWGKGGSVTSAGWQATLCDPMWHVSSRSGVATLRTAIHLLLVTYLRGTGSTKRSSVRPSVRPSDCYLGADDVIQLVVLAAVAAIGNESVPIQLAQCRFPGLAISNAKISRYFSNEIYGSNFIKQHSSETVMV